MYNIVLIILIELSLHFQFYGCKFTQGQSTITSHHLVLLHLRWLPSCKDLGCRHINDHLQWSTGELTELSHLPLDPDNMTATFSHRSSVDFYIHILRLSFTGSAMHHLFTRSVRSAATLSFCCAPFWHHIRIIAPSGWFSGWFSVSPVHFCTTMHLFSRCWPLQTFLSISCMRHVTNA